MKTRLRVDALEARDCPAAGSSLVQVGSGPGYSLSVNTYGRVAVLQVSQAEYNQFANVGIAGAGTLAPAEATITNRLYSVFPDAFDFVLLSTNEDATTSNLLGFNRRVRTVANGLGQPPTDFGAFYGSPSRLSSFLYFADRTQLRNGTGTHEIAHQWANFLANGTTITVGTNALSNGHWGLSDVGGALGGWQKGTLVDLGNGNYTADGPIGKPGWADNDNTDLRGSNTYGSPYSPLELYLMGVLPIQSVPDIQVALNAVETDQLTGDFTATGFRTETALDFLNAYGLRTPVPFSSQRNFRGLNVLLTPTAPTQAQLDDMDTQVELFGRSAPDGDDTHYNFWESTGGRATLEFGGLNRYIPNVGGRVDSLLSVSADPFRITGFPVRNDGTYNTGRLVQPDLSAFLGGFNGEIRTAAGDVNGDSIPDYIIATGPGTVTRFAVVNGDLSGYVITPTIPFRGSESFSGGAFVSAGDLDGDGFAEIAVTADQGGGPRVTLFGFRGGRGLAVTADFFGIADPAFRGGARSAIGDFNNDGRGDLAVAAGFGGGPRVAVFNGTTLTTTRARLVNDFFAFGGTDATTLRNGVFLAAGDLNGDGFSDLVFGGGPGGGPRVLALNGRTVSSSGGAAAAGSPLANFFVAGDTTSRGGVRVAVKNADGDGRRDIVVGSGEGQKSFVRAYRGSTIRATGEPTRFQDLDPFGGAILPGGVYVG